MSDFTAVQGGVLEAVFENFPPDLTGPVLGIQMTDGSGSTVFSRSTANLTQEPSGSGRYIWRKPISAIQTISDDYLVTLDFNSGVLVPGTFRTATVEIMSQVAAAAAIPPVTSIVPDISEVGSIIRARTKDHFGNELGTFTADTRPTDTEVQLLINKAYAEVVAHSDDDLPPKSYPAARSLIALKAAMLTELSYWPDQIPLNQSPYVQLRQQYEGADGKGGDLAGLLVSINRENEELVSGETAQTNSPHYSFDAAPDQFIRRVW